MDTLLDMIGNIADIAGFISAAFALGAWVSNRRLRKELQLEKERQSQLVHIHLTDPTEQYVKTIPARRAELSRQEVMGILGMIPRADPDQKRFKLDYTSTEQFITDLNFHKSTNKTTWIIQCTEAELAQFDSAVIQPPTGAPSPMLSLVDRLLSKYEQLTNA